MGKDGFVPDAQGRAVLHWYTENPPPLGAVALCGHVRRDSRRYKDGDMCPECEAFKARKPHSDTGIYLSKHEHDWLLVGANLWPVGTWHPVYRCTVCSDVICDLHVDARTWEPS